MGDLFPPTPSSAQRERVLVLDALEQLVSAARLHYRRIQEGALRFGALPSAESDDAREPRRVLQVGIVADVNALIGTAHRLRNLVGKIPGGSATRLMCKSFRAGTRNVEQARHRLEHLEDKISEIAPSGEGAFGAVSWCDVTGPEEYRVIFFVPGTLAPGAQAVIRPVGNVTEKIDSITATIAGQPFDVTGAFRAIEALESRLREWGVAEEEQGWPSLHLSTAEQDNA